MSLEPTGVVSADAQSAIPLAGMPRRYRVLAPHIAAQACFIRDLHATAAMHARAVAAVEVIYLFAVILWICVVLAALAFGVRLWAKYRAKRRRMTRLLDVMRRLPMAARLKGIDPDGPIPRLLAEVLDVGARYRSPLAPSSGSSSRRPPGSTKEIKKISKSRVKMTSADSRSPHWNG